MDRIRYILLALVVCALFGYGQDKPPSTVLIDGHEWRLESREYMPILDDGSGTLGMTYCDQHLIIYKPRQYDLRKTIIHELFHAGTCTDGDVDNTYWNSESKADEHHIGIYRLANFMTNLLRNNPKLAKWLAQ